MAQRISGGCRSVRTWLAERRPGASASLRGLVIAAALAGVTPTTASAGTSDDALTMIMFDRAPGAAQIASGDYALAARIARTMPVAGAASRFESLTQICVASLKCGELAAARSACDRAVIASRAHDLGTPIYGSPDREARTTRRVIALTNRGVVHAISDDEQAAARDFEAALQLNADQREPRANLAYLERRGDYVADSQD